MQPFTSHQGLVAVLWRDNVDTDQIIPKEFLKSVRKVGFGEHLFRDWRYLPDGGENPAFELNRPAARGATVLLAGNNFGCGSSREHAVWAVQQYGFRVVIAPSVERNGGTVPGFADIFRGNAAKNGLLTVEMPLADVEEIKRAVEAEPRAPVRVDLAAQTVSAGSLVKSFPFDPAVKEKLLKGLDDIGQTLQDEAAIAAFEKKRADR